VERELTITEIFYSIQGESLYAGFPTVFIRLTGCPVRCIYCDTPYAFSGGVRLPISTILKEVSRYSTSYVCVTGGEPLAQRNVYYLLSSLIQKGYRVSLETSGVREIRDLPRPLKVVLDLKTPGSGVYEEWKEENLNYLKEGDELKAVVVSYEDLLWVKEFLSTHPLPEGVIVNISPAWGMISPGEVAEFLLKENLPYRLHLQIHKILWPNEIKGR